MSTRSHARIWPVLKVASTLPLFCSFLWAQSVIATIPATNGLSGFPMTIAVNPLTSRVYIAGSNVEVVDQRSNQIIDTIDVGSGNLTGIAVDPVLRRAYVTDNAQGLFAIDLNTNTVSAHYGYANDTAVAVNPVTHRVYMQAHDAATGAAGLFVFDGPNLNLIATIDDSGTYQPFGDPEDQIAINPVTNMIYVGVNLYPGAIWVVNGKTNTSVTTITGLAPLAYGIDVDPFRNLIWLGGWFGDLSEVNGATNKMISDNSSMGSQPEGVSVDPANQKVYVVIQQQGEVQIVDEKTNTLQPTTIPVGTTPVNSAIDYLHGLLYVGNTAENVSNPPAPSVSVIKIQ